MMPAKPVDESPSLRQLESYLDEFREIVYRLYLWQEGRSTSFSGHLFDLCAKADRFNLGRIAAGFPLEVIAFKQWQACDSFDSKEKFFAKHGVDTSQ